MLIYGQNTILYYLRNYSADITELFIDRSRKDHKFESEIKRYPKINKVDSNFFLNNLRNVNHQGIAARVKPFSYKDLTEIDLSARPLVVILDSVQDPANLGAVLRTSEAFGVTSVIIPKDRAAEVTPAVIRASAGAARGVDICKVVNITRTIEYLKDKNLWVTAVEDHRKAKPYYAHDMSVPLVLLFGSEGSGIRRLPLEKSDMIINIPTYGKVQSLNVSVSAGIVIAEAAKARKNNN